MLTLEKETPSKMAEARNKQKGALMFEVTEKAREMIKNFMKDKEGPSSVRVTMMEGG